MTLKIRKVRKKRINSSLLLLLFSLLVYISTRTFLGSYTVTLNIQYQENQEKIIELTKEAETLLLEVQSLTTYDRIIAIVNNSDLEANVGNVINVGN